MKNVPFFLDSSLWKQYNVHDSSQTTHIEKLVEDSGKKVKPTRIVKVSDGVYKVKPQEVLGEEEPD